MSRYFYGECPEPKHAWLEAKLRAWVLKMGVELSGFTEAELRQVPDPAPNHSAQTLSDDS